MVSRWSAGGQQIVSRWSADGQLEVTVAQKVAVEVAHTLQANVKHHAWARTSACAASGDGQPERGDLVTQLQEWVIHSLVTSSLHKRVNSQIIGFVNRIKQK